MIFFIFIKEKGRPTQIQKYMYGGRGGNNNNNRRRRRRRNKKWNKYKAARPKKEKAKVGTMKNCLSRLIASPSFLVWP
jgi:hypothetical protein